MDFGLGIIDMILLFFNLINHRIQQYFLCTAENVVLETNSGRIKGVKRHTLYKDATYYSFEGIPYAKPPLGELRFLAPQPAVPWTGIRDCTSSYKKPLQDHMIAKIIDGSEDCLYLNVYTKKLESERPLPVMIYIYGGAFQVGEATRDLYSPDYFMQQDVIIVTLNYRVGALGFLSLSDPELQVPGNAGLKDQLMALRWIKANIAKFNGDSENITVFGESAGSASTHLLMLSDKARGLFHKAILQSGSALSNWANIPPRQWAYRLAHKLGYNGADNDKSILQFLRQIKARKIAKVDNKLLTKDEIMMHVQYTFGPVVEPYIGEDCLLPRPFIELQRNAWGNEIPLMLGCTSFEGLLFYQKILRKSYMVNELYDCESLIPDDAKQGRSEMEIRKSALKIKHAYFGDKQPCITEHLFQYMHVLSDLLMWHGTYRIILCRSAAQPNVPTYFYRFDFDSPHFNHFRILTCGKTIRGVSHADDLSYLFLNADAGKLPTDSAEYKTIERMIGMWTSFAATSNPNCDAIRPAIWEPVQAMSKTRKCLNISHNVEFIDLPEQKILDMWDSLYTRETLY